MSSEQKASEDVADDKPGIDLKALIPLAGLAVSVLVLIAMLLLAVQVSSLSDEVAALRKQVKATVRMTQSISDDLAAMNTLRGPASPAAKRPPPTDSAPSSPSHVDAADPRQDCVIRPGKSDGLSNCLKEGSGK